MDENGVLTQANDDVGLGELKKELHQLGLKQEHGLKQEPGVFFQVQRVNVDGHMQGYYYAYNPYAKPGPDGRPVQGVYLGPDAIDPEKIPTEVNKHMAQDYSAKEPDPSRMQVNNEHSAEHDQTVTPGITPGV